MRAEGLLCDTMTIKKRIFAFICVFLLSQYLGVFGSRVLAADKETLLAASADNPSPAVGDTVTVTVSLTGNAGFAALQFDVLYDKAVLSCLDCRRGALLKNATLAAANPDDDGAITVAAASLEEIGEDGVAAVLTFKVVGQGEAGLALSLAVLCDAAYKDVACGVSADRVTARGSAPGGSAPASGGGAFSDGEDYSGRWDDYDGAVSGADGAPSASGASGAGGVQAGPFADTAGHWAEKNIEKISALGLITGFEDGSFRPDDRMTRAQFAVILWRLAGRPEPAGAARFSDIGADWYRKAAAWASEMGYINGDGERFLPDRQISRQEIVTMLFRYSGGVPGAETLLAGVYDGIYEDSGELASWGRGPMYWAVYKGIISGVTEKRLDPGGRATRAQVAAIVARYLENGMES